MASLAAPRRWLLAIDASTEHASLALFDGAALAVLSWPAGRNQTSDFLSEIARLGELAGCDPRTDVGCVAVATGPGMFNGLRVAMSIAKGYALASGAALVGVPTLRIAAEPFSGRVVVIAAAGRSRLLWQTFVGGEPIGEAVNGQFGQLLDELGALDEIAAVTGEMSADQWLAVGKVPLATIAPPPTHLRRAGALAAIGWRRWQAGDTDEPAALEPIYLHAKPTAN
jgi:tRNA threonylcarbamoyladenosine biosynthesis protein TsaB